MLTPGASELRNRIYVVLATVKLAITKGAGSLDVTARAELILRNSV